MGESEYAEAPLHLYDVAKDRWANLGDAVIYPSWHEWEWWKPLWNPFSADGETLAFATPDGSVVLSSSDRERRTVVTRVSGGGKRPGLAVASPDGSCVAWVTFEVMLDERSRGAGVKGAQVFVARAEKDAE